MVTITDISKACGVSRATVSKALNGAPDVSPETTKRIREVAASLGYLPNAAARALKMGRSYNLGVLFSEPTGVGLTHEYFSRIFESIKAEAERLGYDITFISQNLGTMTMDYLEHTRYRSCDGVVIASADFHDYANGVFEPALWGKLYNAGSDDPAHVANYPATDLAGNVRIFGRKPIDIGCYECVRLAGTTVILH